RIHPSKRILIMSDKNFSRRRRGMRFRPKGGLGPNPQKPDREAIQARADVVSEQGGNDHVFEKRHNQEIDRAENIAAGLPPQGAPPPAPEPAEPAAAVQPIAAPVAEEEFAPVKITEGPKGLIETIKTAAGNL